MIAISVLLLSSCYRNYYWRHIDKRLIHKLDHYDLDDPNEVEAFFLKHNRSDFWRTFDLDSLGYGWSSNKFSVGGGYIAINGEFLYYNDSVVSYKLSIDKPPYQFASKYLQWYSEYFEIKKNGSPIPLTMDTLLYYQPLEYYKGPLDYTNLDSTILFFMSPYSGISYQFKNCDSTVLSRIKSIQTFEAIKTDLSELELEILFFSKNPASRLRSIEYYLNNKSNYPNLNKDSLWIENVLNNDLRIHCLECLEDSVFKHSYRLELFKVSEMECLKYLKSD